MGAHGETLIGREAERRDLEAALAAAIGGTAQIREVRGPAGVGKTALLAQLAESAARRAQVRTISGHPAEEQLPYAGIHQLLHSAAPAQAADLPEDNPLRAATAVLAAVTRLADAQPLLLIVDDAHWMDAASRRAVVFAARRLEAERVLIVFGTRPEAEPLGVGPVIELAPLGHGEAVELLTTQHPDLSARVAGLIAERAGGLPLALAEIPSDLTPAQRAGTAALPEVLPLGASLTELFTKRITAQPDPTRLALLGASFEPLDAARLRHVLRLLETNLDAFDPAERAGLVRLVDGTCRFRHPSVPAAMQNLARAAELTAVHRALATAFADDPRRAAAHLLRGDDVSPTDRRDAAVAGAEAAARAGSHAEAGALWAAAADLSHQLHDPDGERAQRRRALQSYLRVGAAPEARAVAERLLQSADDPVERAHVTADLVSISMWTLSAPPGDHKAIEQQGIALRDDDDPALRTAGLRLLTVLTTTLFSAGRYDEAHRLGEHLSAGRAEPDLEQRLLQDITAVMVGAPGAGHVLRSDWNGDYDWTRILDPRTPAGHITVVLGWLGEYTTLERAIEAARAVIDEHGGTACGLYVLRSMTITHDRHRGRWDRALAGFDALEKLGYDTDFLAPFPFFALRQAHLLAARGDAEACEAIRARARDRAPAWTPAMAHLDHCVEGLLALSRRDFPAAAEALARAAELESASGAVTSGYLSRVPDAFEAAWRLGSERFEELERFEQAMTAVGHDGMLALAARCRALVAPPGEMDALFERALALLQTETDGFEAARTRLLWGERLRRARRRRDARAQLTQAEQTFSGLGADAWAAQCGAELAACGVRRATPVPGDADPVASLTPREFDVAREVAAGATNAEAAQRLFISERTAEFHLQNVYRKLGLHNRQELAVVLTR